ncbi:MAG: hypothetical protein WC314_21290 [Vulcanimicrobiota bacterium]
MLEVRPLRFEDREDLRTFCEQREYPDSVFASPELARRLTLEDFEPAFESVMAQDEIFSLVAVLRGKIVGYVLGRLNETESITQDPQTEIINYSVSAQPVFHMLMAESVRLAREAGDHYLVCHTTETQEREKRWAEAFGLKTELYRTYMTVKAGESFPSHPEYLVRRARDHEMLFVMSVVANHSPAYIPAHRPVDKKAVQAGFVDSYSSIRSNDKKKVPLVLYHKPSGDLLGYMILMPQRLFRGRGPLAMYMYDIAIGSLGEGKGLSRWLALGSKALMAKMGGGLLFGDVSPENKLALSATLALGSRIDSRRWGIKV